jgi:hypothetical protein
MIKAHLSRGFGLEADGVGEALGFRELIDVRCGKSGIAPEIAPQLVTPIGEQTSIGRDQRTMELQLKPTVETGPKWAAI